MIINDEHKWLWEPVIQTCGFNTGRRIRFRKWQQEELKAEYFWESI